jgi:transcriptional regulator with XRE-family HTH domain
MSNSNMEEFQKKLKLTREKRGLSQSDLARISGLQPSAISHFENGRRSPSFDNLKIIADALSVSLDYLLGREPESGAGGPTMQRIFRGASEMSQSDLDTFAEMADMLAAKNKKKGDQS